MTGAGAAPVPLAVELVSRQPQKRPGVSQVVLEGEELHVVVVVSSVVVVVVVLSLQPNQPGVSQVEVEDV